MSGKTTGWKEFYKEKLKELKVTNPKIKVTDASPLIKEMWKEYKKETEFEIDDQDIPEEEIELEQKQEVKKEVITAPETTKEEEFKFQCEKCSYLFNEKISKCPKCGVDFVW